MTLDQFTRTKILTCKCGNSFIIKATAQLCKESVYNLKATYEVIGAKEVHGYSIICHCKKWTRFEQFAGSFESAARKLVTPEMVDNYPMIEGEGAPQYTFALDTAAEPVQLALL